MRHFAQFVLLSSCALQGQTFLQYTITTFAGNGTRGFAGDNSASSSAQLGGPSGVAVDGTGNLYIADQFNNRVRKIANGTISTVAGSGVNSYSGDGKAATAASLSAPTSVALDSAGNLYIADSSNYVVRKVSTSGTITTFAGTQNQGPGYGGDGGPATSAVLSHPAAIVFDGQGNLFIADTGNNVVRQVSSSGVISTVAGYGAPGFSGDGGPAVNAKLNTPIGLAFDRAGNLYVADSGNNRVRMISGGTITTVAGTGISGHAGDGGLAAKAQLSTPKGLAMDLAGNLYIADSLSSRVRVVGANGIISTIAGNGTFGYSGDGGTATGAQLFSPSEVAVTSSGLVYIADTQNNAVRLLTPQAGLPVITPGGISAASAFGGGSSVSPGDWIEIYGSQFGADPRSWRNSDFNGASAPTALDGVSVTVGGQSAFVDYISQGQINAQLPSTVGTGTQLITVTTPLGTSAPYQLTVNPVQPGILAPSAFKVGNTQFAAALFADGSTYALPPNAVPAVTSRAAKPGEIITFYGVGFGTVLPAIFAGQIVGQMNALTTPLAVTVGGVPATLSYAGLAPGTVGLYQINVTVPAASAGDAIPVAFTLGSNTVQQTLFIAVGS